MFKPSLRAFTGGLGSFSASHQSTRTNASPPVRVVVVVARVNRCIE
jgi:hypothetical protein